MWHTHFSLLQDKWLSCTYDMWILRNVKYFYNSVTSYSTQKSAGYVLFCRYISDKLIVSIQILNISVVKYIVGAKFQLYDWNIVCQALLSIKVSFISLISKVELSFNLMGGDTRNKAWALSVEQHGWSKIDDAFWINRAKYTLRVLYTLIFLRCEKVAFSCVVFELGLVKSRQIL